MGTISMTAPTIWLSTIRVSGADSYMLPRFILYFYPDDVSNNSDRSIIKTFYNYMDCFMYRRKILREKKLDGSGNLIIKVRMKNDKGEVEEF